MGDLAEAKLSPVGGVEYVPACVFDFPRESTEVISPSRAPPPDGPVYLRFSVLRL